MVGSPLILLGLLAGWADPCCKGTAKVTECNPKRPLIQEVENETECPNDKTFNRKFIFPNAANFPDHRFFEPPRVSPSLWIPAPERGELCPPGIICIGNDNRPQPQGFFIHEGMTLRIHDKGKFVLVFQATTPDTTVDLRLKFNFQAVNCSDKCKNNPMCRQFPTNADMCDSAIEAKCRNIPESFSLTLPPIVIPPKTVDGIDLFLANPRDTQDQTRFITIVYEGYSPLLENQNLVNSKSCLKQQIAKALNLLFGCTPDIDFVGTNFSIQRLGKARFGTPLSR